jgi:hypothetical protein
MTPPVWLTRYYAADELDTLRPTILFEGKSKAVVMLRANIEGATRIGYVLISKNGKNNVSTHEALHEGPAALTDISRMRRRLTEVDSP